MLWPHDDHGHDQSHCLPLIDLDFEVCLAMAAKLISHVACRVISIEDSDDVHLCN